MHHMLSAIYICIWSELQECLKLLAVSPFSWYKLFPFFALCKPHHCIIKAGNDFTPANFKLQRFPL